MQLLLFLLSTLGCTNSGLGRDPTGDTGPTVAECPWVGAWALQTVNCSTIEYDAWEDDYQSAEMLISQDPEGGCAVEMTLQGEACTRIEEWHFGPPTGTEVEVTFGGITDCTPNRCLFEASSDPCAQGELAAEPQTLVLDENNGTMNAKGLLVDTAEGCPLDIYTVWKKG